MVVVVVVVLVVVLVVVVVVVVFVKTKEIIVVRYCYRGTPLKLECRYQFFNFNSYSQ